MILTLDNVERVPVYRLQEDIEDHREAVAHAICDELLTSLSPFVTSGNYLPDSRRVDRSSVLDRRFAFAEEFF